MILQNLPRDGRPVLYSVYLILAAGCVGLQPDHCCVVKNEMRLLSHSLYKAERPDLPESIGRLRLAGENCVSHLAYALESDEVIHRKFGGQAINVMTDSWKWKKAYHFALQRLSKNPKSNEAGQLLFGLAHVGVASYPEVVNYAKHYLDDTTFVIRLAINSPTNIIEMRVCDYAGLVIQYAAIGRAPDAKDWGLGKTRLMTRATLDEELPLIKKWVEAHPNWVKERQRELRKQRMAEEKDSKRKLKPGPEPEDAP